MRERISDEQPRMDGGLNNVSDDASLLPTQLRVATNARLTEYGAITKRGGTQRTSVTALGSGSSGFVLLEASGLVLLESSTPENNLYILLEN